MMTHDEMIAVIAAHRDGKKIQAASKAEKGEPRDWHDTSPTWDFFSCDYRVKPEPIEAWSLVSKSGKVIDIYCHYMEAKANMKNYPESKIVRLVPEGGEA